LTFDLLTLKAVSESLCANFGLPSAYIGLSVLDLGPMYATDRQADRRQTDVRQKHRLMPPPIRGGHNN